jgi:hypothetical protein
MTGLGRPAAVGVFGGEVEGALGQQVAVRARVHQPPALAEIHRHPVKVV